MFGIPPDDDDNNVNIDEAKDNLAETLLVTKPRSERSLSRPPSIVSLQKTTATDSGDGQSPPRQRKQLGQSPLLRTPPTDRKEDGISHPALKDKGLPKIPGRESEESDLPESDSESVGSVEGSYELLKDDSPVVQELMAPPFRERALSMPFIPPTGVFSGFTGDDDDEDPDAIEDFQDAEQGPDVIVVMGDDYDQQEEQHTRL